MINIKNVDPKLLSIDKISFKSIDFVAYHIKHITMKSLDYVNIHSENPFYLIFNNVNGYIEESNEDKYWIFASTDKKKVLKNTHEIKNQIEKINGGEPIK